MRQHNSPCGTSCPQPNYPCPGHCVCGLFLSESLVLSRAGSFGWDGCGSDLVAIQQGPDGEWWGGTLPARCDNVGQCWSLNRSLFLIQCVCSMLGNSLCSSTFGHCHCHGLDNLSQRFHDMLSSRRLKHSKDGVSALVSTWYQHRTNMVNQWNDQLNNQLNAWINIFYAESSGFHLLKTSGRNHLGALIGAGRSLFWSFCA